LQRPGKVAARASTNIPLVNLERERVPAAAEVFGEDAEQDKALQLHCEPGSRWAGRLQAKEGHRVHLTTPFLRRRQ